jgi:hypothetical protein
LTRTRDTEENISNTNKRKKEKEKKKKEKRKKRVHVCDGNNETGKEFEGALVLSNSLRLFFIFLREFEGAWFCRKPFAVKGFREIRGKNLNNN